MAYMYDALYLYLQGHPQSSITLSFSRIEQIIGRPLPQEAEQRPEWWSNEANKHPDNVQCLAWLQLGYRAFPDFTLRTVRFERGGASAPR
jgi:hypothetical protein